MGTADGLMRNTPTLSQSTSSISFSLANTISSSFPNGNHHIAMNYPSSSTLIPRFHSLRRTMMTVKPSWRRAAVTWPKDMEDCIKSMPLHAITASSMRK